MAEVIGEVSSHPSNMLIKWKIFNVSSLSEKVDQCYRSQTIKFLNEEWYLYIYLNGQTKYKSVGWIVPYISVLKSKKDFKQNVTYKFFIKRTDGAEYKYESSPLFTNSVPGYGTYRLLERSELFREKDLIAPNDTLTVYCSVSADKAVESEGNESLKDSKEREENNTDLDEKKLEPSGSDKLANDLKSLLSTGEDSDVTITIQDSEFKVHKGILRVRSPVFFSMLGHDMLERKTGNIDITDCDPETFKYFLSYLYSGSVEKLSHGIAVKLYSVADKYDAPEVKIKCVDFLSSNISIETFCEILMLALRHDELALLEKTTKFFARNLKTIIVTGQWLTFIKENPLEGNELYVKAMDYYVIRE